MEVVPTFRDSWPIYFAWFIAAGAQRESHASHTLSRQCSAGQFRDAFANLIPDLAESLDGLTLTVSIWFKLF
jgi:hypothetical protein